MTGDDDMLSGHVKAPINFMLRRVAKKHAQCRVRQKFVGDNSGMVRITMTTEHPKVVICVRRTVEHM